MNANPRLLLVLGGSRGIGAAVARRGVADGYRVVIGYHAARDAAESLIAELTDHGGQVLALQVDVSDADSVEAFFSSAERVWGAPTAVVFASGIAGSPVSLIDLPAVDIGRVLDTNLLGAFYALQAAARRMVRSRGGSGGAIVVISSEAGKFGGNRLSPYAASKAGLNALVIGAARELAPEGVRLNGVSPGVIDTEQQACIGDERRHSLLASIPLGRMGDPAEVANAVLWLLSADSAYVVGSVLSIAGGR
jgi:NAD(P)-dependent dehydrogenase (short-subunit alcohol dehydrogenase family)